MTTEKQLPPVNPVEAIRLNASKIGKYTLYREKAHRPVDFIRSSAGAERKLITQLSLSNLGEAALYQFGQDDTVAHIDSPS